MLFLKQEQKMMDLMMILYRHENEWMTYGELAKMLQCSKKTLDSYLAALEKLFPDSASFKNVGSMVCVTFCPNFSVLTLQRQFFCHTLVAKILWSCFLTPNKDKLDLTLEMHSSESSIYRNVQRLNKALSPCYKLHFSYKEMAFSGQEEEIRAFYTNFFIEMSHATSRWPFSGLVEEEDVHHLICCLAQDIRLAPFPNHFIFLKYASAVALIRVQQGQEISSLDPQPFLHEVFKKMAGRPVVQEILEKYLPLTAGKPVDALYQIFGSFIANGYLPFLTDPKGRDWARENYKVHYLFFKDLIADLTEKYNLTIDDPDELYYKLFIYMRFKAQNIDAAGFFIDYTANMASCIQPYNPALYKDLYTRLDKHLTQYAPAFHNKLPYLIYNIYMLWPKLLSQLLVSRPPCRALVISQYDKNYAESLTDLLNTLNLNLLQVDTYDAYLVDMEAIKASSYELFITDFPLDDLAPDKMVLSFEQLPLPHQLQQLLLTVTNSILKKRQGAALRIGHKPEAVALSADRPENPLL